MGGLGKRTDCGDARYAGLEVAWSSDIVETLEVRRWWGSCYAMRQGISGLVLHMLAV